MKNQSGKTRILQERRLYFGARDWLRIRKSRGVMTLPSVAFFDVPSASGGRCIRHRRHFH